jgi:hypothetical protein
MEGKFPAPWRGEIHSLFVRISPLISFIAAPRVLGSIEAITIVTRGVSRWRELAGRSIGAQTWFPIMWIALQ